MSEQKSDYDEKYEKDLAEIHTLLEKRKKRKAKIKRAKFEKLCSCRNVLSDLYYYNIFIKIH